MTLQPSAEQQGHRLWKTSLDTLLLEQFGRQIDLLEATLPLAGNRSPQTVKSSSTTFDIR